MIYVLIFILVGIGKSSAVSVEFNSLEACQAAAMELSRQSVRHKSLDGPLVVCAQKGLKP